LLVVGWGVSPATVASAGVSVAGWEFAGAGAWLPAAGLGELRIVAAEAVSGAMAAVCADLRPRV
jgi:hypothetical protein